MKRNPNSSQTGLAGAQSNGQLIFLAEDDPDDIYLFERAMRDLQTRHGLNVFRNGQELFDALKGTESAEPDIIFLDINMPVQNGLECLSNIRKHYSKVLPVFLFSTAQDRLTVEEARKLGATGYLSKPSSVEDLSGLLANLLAISWRTRSANDFYVHLQLADT